MAQLQSPRAGASYRRAIWVPKAKIVDVKAQLLRNFLHREASGDRLPLPPAHMMMMRMHIVQGHTYSCGWHGTCVISGHDAAQPCRGLCDCTMMSSLHHLCSRHGVNQRS